MGIFSSSKKKEENQEKISTQQTPELPPLPVPEGIKGNDSVGAGDQPLFRIEQPTIPGLPDAKDQKLINVKYPLIPPYAFAVIRWDEPNKELVYEIEEPKLDEKEKQTLDILEDGIKELINLSFISVQDKQTILVYLEKNIRVLLTELSIDLAIESYLKIMYYIYRDFVGLNELEPLMNDYFIEDIECNGLNSPVYLVHRKYRNIRTNLIYKDIHKMASFVEKLAQKCGRYVSYAEPLLDGSLPDGSRVQAVYSTDVASRGPSFTVRRFTKEPWSPIQLMIKGTASAEIYAYLWMTIEYENSMMIVGGTGSGKCVTAETPVYLANGEKKKIKNLVEEKFKNRKTTKQGSWEYVENSVEVLSMDPETLKIVKTKTDKLWRHKSPRKLIMVKTRSGREITTTPEHPFFTMENGELKKIRADKIGKGEVIAVPRAININNPEIKEINYLEYIRNRKDLYYTSNKDINGAVRKITGKKHITETQLAKNLGVKYNTFKSWKEHNATPLNNAYKLLNEANIKIRIDKIKVSKQTQKIKLPKLCPSLFRFIAYVLADGHLAKNHVMLFNINQRIRKEFLDLGYKLFEVKGKEEFPKDRTPKCVFNSKYMATILHDAFNIPYGNKARIIKIPEQLHLMGNKCISNFLSALFNCESYVGKDEIEFSTTSKFVAEDMCSLLLRFSIVPRLIKRSLHYRVYISGYHNLARFNNNIGYTHPKKSNAMDILLSRPISRLISNVDLIPNISKIIQNSRKSLGATQDMLARNIDVSRRLVGMWEDETRSPSIITFKKFNSFVQTQELDIELKRTINNITESDIFWDEIKWVKTIKKSSSYVYDITVPKTHNFLAGEYPIVVHNTSFVNTVAFFIPPQARVVSIEDTKELQLEHENWLPSVARAGVGLTNLVGQRYGEVSLFDLLRASFRQRPDYIIVGEVRGKEAFVLFQSFASGHPGMATMHAESVNTLIKRLETEPINLSGSLIETLAAVVVMSQTKVKGKDVRKVSSIDEIVQVKEGTGEAVTNNVFSWDPKTDTFIFNPNSRVFDNIATHFGFTKEQVLNEFKIRSRLLKEMFKRGIVGFKEVQAIVQEYYKSPELVLKRFRII